MTLLIKLLIMEHLGHMQKWRGYRMELCAALLSSPQAGSALAPVSSEVSRDVCLSRLRIRPRGGALGHFCCHLRSHCGEGFAFLSKARHSYSH